MTNAIETAKQQYFAKIAKKLSDPNNSYCSILKCFLTDKKVPCIPPIFHENRFIIDFREKAEFFNSFFANQCSLVRNSSASPTDFELFPDKTISNITFTNNDIERIISGLDPNKVHDHDMMSICRLNICGDCINKSIGLICRAYLEHGSFSQNWKKANVVPIHKKLQAINKEL